MSKKIDLSKGTGLFLDKGKEREMKTPRMTWRKFVVTAGSYMVLQILFEVFFGPTRDDLDLMFFAIVADAFFVLAYVFYFVIESREYYKNSVKQEMDYVTNTIKKLPKPSTDSSVHPTLTDELPEFNVHYYQTVQRLPVSGKYRLCKSTIWKTVVSEVVSIFMMVIFMILLFIMILSNLGDEGIAAIFLGVTFIAPGIFFYLTMVFSTSIVYGSPGHYDKLASTFVYMIGVSFLFFGTVLFSVAFKYFSPLVVIFSFLSFLGSRALMSRLLLGYKREPINLLILRTFGDERNSSFLTRWLRPRWNAIGPTFTLGSDDLIEARTDSVRVFFVYYGVFSAFIAISLSVLVYMTTGKAIIGLVMCPMICVLFYLLARPITRVFTKLEFRLSRRLLNKNAKDLMVKTLGGRYRNIELFCHSDYWTRVLGRIVSKSDFIIMDMRGFNKSDHKGLVYEVEYLINNNFNLRKVCFFVSTQDDVSRFKEVFGDLWHKSSREPPNGVNSPQIHIYIMTESDRRNVQGVIRLVCYELNQLLPGGNNPDC